MRHADSQSIKTVKKTADTGLPLHDEVPALDVIDSGFRKFCVQEYIRGAKSALFFVSVTCIHCVDLLPYLSEIEEQRQFRILLFSAGEREDHEAMVDFFGWTFPVVSMNSSEMKALFQVEYLPFAIVANEQGIVSSKGVLYNANDFGLLVRHSRE
ncbi:thioredoxin-like domain-containing protein [Cohnella faecalis]|uniref:Thioredoxin-like fold domain-containing protein n=1 Tax=Cohnella faecalis TaxID=2315694 RepID=A0A398CVA9_9BACL|nr:thioredoxin-like domain-containing protein [Cohnella faecalis]RIE05229.1 hypothetical protein D3H35_01530 [Cohnella faecalis]